MTNNLSKRNIFFAAASAIDLLREHPARVSPYDTALRLGRGYNSPIITIPSAGARPTSTSTKLQRRAAAGTLTMHHYSGKVIAPDMRSLAREKNQARLANARWILWGPQGTGKTTIARQLADKLNLSDIVDEWDGSRDTFNEEGKDGAIFITNELPNWARGRSHVISVKQAERLVGR